MLLDQREDGFGFLNAFGLGLGPATLGTGPFAGRPAAKASDWLRDMEMMAMTAETIRDLLEPIVGKSGSIFIIVNRIGPIGFATTEHKKLTGVQIRPDGLIHLERETGWAVLDPGEVVAVVWNGDTESSPGQFL